ncbi:hypothetical protein F8S09_16685 [Deinococcus sp. SDU3-2]|uniref:Uncharacterized protein n=1 Tax=Deinococcus terrestris TaxID=2651870 RepID=A0A7X1NZR5_9DEIO|nr:hypothetical protein [Deinococcus terrestris]MPY68294.1 hypothetical protein [Deinococcus terrestris]
MSTRPLRSIFCLLILTVTTLAAAEQSFQEVSDSLPRAVNGRPHPIPPLPPTPVRGSEDPVVSP